MNKEQNLMEQLVRVQEVMIRDLNYKIENLNTISPNGYNSNSGGEGGFSPCEETRLKMKM